MSQDVPVYDKSALQKLLTDYSIEEIREMKELVEVFEPEDVLYYVDSYGDLEMATVLQRFDQSLPSGIHKALYHEYQTGGWDVLEMQNTKNISSTECPGCNTELYHFNDCGCDLDSMTEHGDIIHVSHLDDKKGMYWYPCAEDTGNKFMCRNCRDYFHNHDDCFGAVRIHLPRGSNYNYNDQIAGFTTSNGVIRFDGYYKDSQTLWVPLHDVSNSLNMMEFAEVFSQSHGEGLAKLYSSGFTKIKPKEFVKNPQDNDRAFKRLFKKTISEWAKMDCQIIPNVGMPVIILGGRGIFTMPSGCDQLRQEIAKELEERGAQVTI